MIYNFRYNNIIATRTTVHQMQEKTVEKTGIKKKATVPTSRPRTTLKSNNIYTPQCPPLIIEV